jgi:hypothetical protein
LALLLQDRHNLVPVVVVIVCEIKRGTVLVTLQASHDSSTHPGGHGAIEECGSSFVLYFTTCLLTYSTVHTVSFIACVFSVGRGEELATHSATTRERQVSLVNLSSQRGKI